jgi:hypothetical protein
MWLMWTITAAEHIAAETPRKGSRRLTNGAMPWKEGTAR